MPSQPPAAFFSYANADDAHDEGRLSRLRERLEREIYTHTATKISIFQDRNHIGWGNNWQLVIDDALDASLFFIPVLTPLFFQSQACRKELQIRGNQLHGGKGSGIFFYDNARGVAEDNNIFENGLSGIEVGDNANPYIRRTQLHHSQEVGVNDWSANGGTFEDNDIFENSLSGFTVSEGSNPIIRNNRIRENAQSGFYIYEGGLGQMSDNKVHGNSYSGVLSSQGANPHFFNNEIFNNREAIFVCDNGKGTFENNILGVHKDKRINIEPACLPNVVLKDNVEDDTLGAEAG